MRPSNPKEPHIILSFNIRAHGNSQDDVSGKPEDYWVRGLDDKEGFLGYEINVSCPNVEGGTTFGTDEISLAQLVKALA